MMVLLFSGCSQEAVRPLAVGDQYGLAYAPVEIMKHEGFLEKRLGRADSVRWIKVSNTAAIREAMLAGELDVGFMAIPPFLIGVDTGMDWKIFTGLSETPVGLMVRAPEVDTLKQLAGLGKIALPQPGSVQHILLAMAAEAQMGNPKAFDGQLVAMKHPDGLQALVSGTEVTAHFTAPPYLQQEQATPGIHQILSGEEAFGGPFTFIVGVGNTAFLEDGSQREAFQGALADALQFMTEQPERTAQILAEAYGISEADASEQLYGQGLRFGTSIRGLETFSAFMTRAGYLTKPIETEAVLWEE